MSVLGRRLQVLEKSDLATTDIVAVSEACARLRHEVREAIKHGQPVDALQAQLAAAMAKVKKWDQQHPARKSDPSTLAYRLPVYRAELDDDRLWVDRPYSRAEARAQIARIDELLSLGRARMRGLEAKRDLVD